MADLKNINTIKVRYLYKAIPINWNQDSIIVGALKIRPGVVSSFFSFNWDFYASERINVRFREFLF